jgi:hypothetical protein
LFKLIEDPVRDAKKIRRRILITLLAVVMWAAAADVVWVRWNRRIPLGHDTTRVTLPLVDGQPDYLGALNESHGAGVMLEENAAPMIYEIMGLRDEAYSLYQKEVAFTWGIALSDGKPLFAEYGTFARDLGVVPASPADASQEGLASLGIADPFHDELWLCMKGPWKTEDHPWVARWIASLEPALGLLDRACARPRFYWPLLSLDGRRNGLASPEIVVLPETITALPRLAEAVIVRANGRLGGGDVVGFEHDATLVMQLARLLAQQPTYQEYLIALAIDSMASEALQHAAASPQLDVVSAEVLRKRAELMPPLRPAAAILDEGERFQMLSGLCLYLRKSTRPAIYSFIPVDYSRALRSLNRQFDSMLDAMALGSAPERIRAMEHLAAEYEAQGAVQSGELEKRMHLENVYLMSTGIHAAALPKQVTENEVNRDLAQAALMLRAAKARGGNFPEKLEELKGSVVPQDRFADKPLRYVRMGTGYMLYSVGPDMGDDGGTPRGAAERGAGWDMVLRVEK